MPVELLSLSVSNSFSLLSLCKSAASLSHFNSCVLGHVIGRVCQMKKSSEGGYC